MGQRQWKTMESSLWSAQPEMNPRLQPPLVYMISRNRLHKIPATLSVTSTSHFECRMCLLLSLQPPPAPVASVESHSPSAAKGTELSPTGGVQGQLVHSFPIKIRMERLQKIFVVDLPAPGPSPARPVTRTIRSPEKRRKRWR